jgi:hypothetical protein
MNASHAAEHPSSPEHIRAVPKPDRRRRRIDVAERRRAADGARLASPATHVLPTMDAAAGPLRIPA